jgi:hypothetical protein
MSRSLLSASRLLAIDCDFNGNPLLVRLLSSPPAWRQHRHIIEQTADVQCNM